MVRWLCMFLACFAMAACDTSGSGTAEALAKPPKPPVTCPPGQAPNAGGKCKPIPVQPPVSCPDGTTVPAGQTCPPVSCPDGSQQPNGSTCPPVNCPDGTQVPNGQTCPPPLPPVNCPDGSTHPAGYVCPPPPPVQCPDGSTVPSGSQCPVIPPPVTWTLCAAGEGDICYVVGTANVRYGAEGKFITKAVTGSISCDFVTFGGDPALAFPSTCDTDGQVGTAPPLPPVQCPDGSTVPAGQSCPAIPPPVASACKPLNLAVGEQLAYADMICTAVQTCQDMRIGQVPFAPPNPVVEQGKRYYVVRGDLWGIPGNVVAWPEGGVPFPGFAGGAFFASRCFAAPVTMAGERG
jgi:hypothetical protein